MMTGTGLRRFGMWLALLIAVTALVAAALILWPAATAPRPDMADDRLIINVRVVDVVQGAAGNPTSVLIRDGRIAAIGPGIGGAGVAVFDARGGYLVPGFWDMHVHSFQMSPQLHFPLFVANGVTGARDMMDCPGAADALIACVADKRRWSGDVAEGRLAAPRIIRVASFYFERPDMQPEEAARLARIYKDRGIDALKVYNRIPVATYARLAREARNLDMPLVGHLPRAIGLNRAIASGQSSFEHAHLFTRHCFAQAEAWRNESMTAPDATAVVEAMVKQHDGAACAAAFAAMRDAGAWFVPTHVTREEDARASDPTFFNDSRLAWLDPLSRWAYRDDLASTVSQYHGERGRRALEQYFDLGLRLTGEAYRAGVPVLVGTDTALGGFRFHDEMALLVRAGLTPAEVLRAATLDAARHAGLDGDHGTVAVGKVADLVVLNADPLADIGNAQSIRAVLVGGRIYDRARLDALMGFVHQQARAPHNWAKLIWGFATSSVSSEL